MIVNKSRCCSCVVLLLSFSLSPLLANEELLIGLDKVFLKDQPRFLSSTITSLHYGSSVSLIESQGGWIKVKMVASPYSIGWIHRQSIGDRKSVLADVGKGKTSKNEVEDDEVSLAAKGFSPEHEKYYQTANTKANFQAVDQIEEVEISDVDLFEFATKGGLNVP